MKIKKNIECKSAWYGNTYGGFYIHPDLLNKESIVYSFGIGEDVSFDLTIIEKHQCKVYGFDPTPKSIEWVNAQSLPTNFIFLPYGIGNKTELKAFYLPKNNNHVSGSIINNTNIDTSHKIEVPLKCFKDILMELNHKKIDVLKMDIEGSEYEVIPDILKTGIVINQLLIEFHNRFVENGKKKTLDAIQLLNSYGYEVFAVSDSFEEVSFIRKEVLQII